jgi:adenylate cyclase
VSERRAAPDHRGLVDQLEAYLLGEEPTLTGQQIADEVGIEFSEASRHWRSLGFSEVGPDVPAFTHADLEALRLRQRLLSIGLIEPEDESAMIRTLGRSFARLAEWQIGMLARIVDLDTMGEEELTQIADEVIPAIEALQSYIWRRHTLSAASRMILAVEQREEAEGGASGDEDADGEAQPDTGEIGTLMAVGFADIVGFTRQSRSLSRRELARRVDHFEDRSLEIVGAHGGRIIKTIGDEILFVADTAHDAALIALDLVEEQQRDEEFPELHVGLAWGLAIARLGDVLGPVVNIASRLTSTARSGTVLVDRALADALADDDSVRLRRLRRTSVRGYRRLEPWSLRRAADDED